MTHSQPGIFALGTRSHHHLQFDLIGDPTAALSAVGRIREAAGTVVGVNVVVGFGHGVWSQLAPSEIPADSMAFESIEGADGFTMPAAQHDLWIWLHGAGSDAVFNVARLASRELFGVAELAAEQACFAYQASQDLTGFEDGTENPPLAEALSVATIPTPGPCAVAASLSCSAGCTISTGSRRSSSRTENGSSAGHSKAVWSSPDLTSRTTRT